MITIDGNFDLNPDDFNDEIEKGIKEDIRKSLSSVVCPTHGKKPQISWDKSGGNLKLKLDCCCDELEKIASAKLEN